MKLHLNRVIPRFSLLLILILVTIGCSRQPPRVKSSGLPQREYTYQIPNKIADGWKVSSLEDEGVNSKKIGELIENILKEKIDNIDSLLMVRNGKLILEEYFYGYGRDVKHEMRSATKSIVSILVGIAIDQNMLSNVDMMVYEFFPEYKGTKWIDQQYGISLKHLLTMTAGLEYDEWSYPYHDTRSSVYKISYNTDNWEKNIFDLNLILQPGEKFTYNSYLTHLLGEITRKATGKPTVKFAEEYLFTPLGISEYTWKGPPWSTGLSLRPRDMAKIGYLFLRKGKWDGKHIVSSGWVNESTKSHVTAFLGGSEYGYQWWRGKTVINNKTIHAYYAAGRGGQYIFVCPSLHLVTVITSKVYGDPIGSVHPQIMMTEYIIPAMFSLLSPPEKIELETGAGDEYIGEYESNIRAGEKLKIFSKGNEIYCNGFGEKFKMLYEAENRYTGTLNNLVDLQFKFFRGKGGRVEQVIITLGFARLQYNRIK